MFVFFYIRGSFNTLAVLLPWTSLWDYLLYWWPGRNEERWSADSAVWDIKSRYSMKWKTLLRLNLFKEYHWILNWILRSIIEFSKKTLIKMKRRPQKFEIVSIHIIDINCIGTCKPYIALVLCYTDNDYQYSTSSIFLPHPTLGSFSFQWCNFPWPLTTLVINQACQSAYLIMFENPMISS